MTGSMMQSRANSQPSFVTGLALADRRAQLKKSVSTRGKRALQACLPYTKVGPIDNVSKIAIGTWSWGNRFLFDYDTRDDVILEEAFQEAVTRGISLFDTADSYGTGRLSGRAETLLGRFLRDNASVTSDVRVATKYASYPWRLTRASIVDAAARSAERLGRPADLGQIHWSAAAYAPWQERALWDGLADAQDAGYCRHIGVSNYGAQGLRAVAQYMQQERGIQLAAAQVQVSLLSRVHVQKDGVCDAARALDVGVVGYSPLCLGLLSGKYDQEKRAGGARDALFRRLRAQRLLQALREVAAARNVTVAQVALAWCARQDVVVLVGARTPEQVRDAIGATQLTLSESEVAALEGAADQGRQMIQNLFQTK